MMRATITILLTVVTNAVSQCDYGNSVYLTNRTYNGIKYEDGEYFVDNTTGMERGCVCMKEKCIRKCCPLGQVYNMDIIKCVDYDLEFDPPITEGYKLKPGFHAAKEFHWLINKMNCSQEKDEYRIAVGQAVTNYYLETDGKLYIPPENGVSTLVYGPDKYCVDNFLSTKAYASTDITFNGLVCYVVEKIENHYALNASCMIISCIFFILTIAVYAFLPNLRNINGIVLMAYPLCMFVTFLCLSIMQLKLLVDNITVEECVALTFIIYFSMLASFFWLNVMCYDLWSKFGLPSRSGTGIVVIRVLFLKYSAYAFGVPAALTILVAFLEFSELLSYSKYLPNLRRQGCFIYGVSKMIYLYTPIVLICIVNLMFFILTAKRIALFKKKTQSTKSKKDTRRFSLYIKLFVVTGINWLLEVLSSIYPDVPYLWQITDMYNVLVGVIFFIIFVCQKKILKALKKRYKQLRGTSTNLNNSNTTISKETHKLSKTKNEIPMATNVSPQSKDKQRQIIFELL